MKTDAELCFEKIDAELEAGRITAREAEVFRGKVKAKQEQKQKVLDDFESGKIDEMSLNRWQISISGDFRALAKEIDYAQINKKKKAEKEKKLRRRLLFAGVVLLVLVGVLVVKIPEWQHAHRTINGIPEPIQIDIKELLDKGKISETEKTISGNGYKVSMNYLASYDIKGLVVELDDFDTKFGARAFDLAIPRDISMAWGKAAEIADQITWGHGARSLNIKYDSGVLYSAGLSRLDFLASVSNNHVIVDDGELRSQLKKVKIGDYIEMKGYLVSAVIYDGEGRKEHSVSSSLTRSDHVNYTFDMHTSCEVLYLTEIRWLD